MRKKRTAEKKKRWILEGERPLGEAGDGEHKLQWYLVRRQSFGLTAMLFYGAEEGFFGSDAFERMWNKYSSGDWEEKLKNMGVLEGWARH